LLKEAGVLIIQAALDPDRPQHLGELRELGLLHQVRVEQGKLMPIFGKKLGQGENNGYG
jgi:hypothetical protein